MSIESRYPKNSGNLIYLPTIEACDFFKINRLPKNYSGSANGTNRFNMNSQQNNGVQDFNTSAPSPSIPATGPQFSTFNSTNYMTSLKSLTVPAVNTRDIIVEVLTNRPYTIKTKTVNGVTTSEYEYGKDGNGGPLYRLSISPTNPDGTPFELQITHDHKWGTQTDIFSSILRGASQLIGQADDFIQKIKNVSNATGNASDGYKQLPNRRFDLAETYSSTEKQTIDIPFTLFTPGGTSNGEEAFLRDILDPITLITSFSYPKRQSELGQGVTGELANAVASATQSRTPEQEKLNSLDLINALNPGFRVFVADPPSYVNVYHQGGLFSYKNCYISKFTYKFRNFVDGSDGEIKNIVTDSGVAGILKSVVANANLAYPVVAECVLSIGSTEPLFSDDFVALSMDRSNAALSTGGITSVRTIPSNPNIAG